MICLKAVAFPEWELGAMLMSMLPTDIGVEALQPDQVRVAYLLVQTVDPSLRLRDWVRYAGNIARRAPQKQGILVARRASHRHPCGVVCYRLERRIGRRELVADICAIMDLVRPEGVAKALVTGIGEVARSLECERVRYMASDESDPIQQILRDLGHRPCGLTFVATKAAGDAA